jgi:CRISPR/Cas system-associated exonuclease Cas4 (RecB family)
MRRQPKLISRGLSHRARLVALSFLFLGRENLRSVYPYDFEMMTKEVDNKLQYLKENHESVNVKLSREDIERIRKVADEADKAATGDRYPDGMKDLLFVDTPAL